MRKLLSPALVLGLWSLPGLTLAATYEIEGSHASAEFSVRHLMISDVPGKITGMTGTVVIDDKDPSKSSVNATLDPKTVNTDNAKRDEHLRSPDFFDVAKFPAISFQSTAVKGHPPHAEIVGNLTIHGVTKPVTLKIVELTPEVKDPFGAGFRRGFKASTAINRGDFGLSWNKALDQGGVVLGNEVKITISAELLKK